MRYFKYLALLLLFSCSCDNDPVNPIEPTPENTVFAKGADISWVTQMEKEGVSFYNSQGVKTDCFALMKSLGMNAIRLRVWVNPTDGWNGKEDVLAKAKRANDLGMAVMINFHYSDSWADPGKQNKPAAWKSLDMKGLKAAITTHTRDVLSALKANNIYPEWIQIGNETTNGMLWDDGKASKSMKNYAELNNAGFYAAKEVFPNAKVMIHIDNGWDKEQYKWLLSGIAEYGARYDMIGMSLYPEPDNWSLRNIQCIENINYVATTFNTKVIICEVGMSWDKAAECKAFLSDLIEKAKTQTNGKCTGVLYWEPQGYVNWSHYTKSAFDNSGRPTIALDAFKD